MTQQRVLRMRLHPSDAVAFNHIVMSFLLD
jgi:hypothetical protein